MESSHPPLVRTRLSIMMFLEFFVWGSWGVAITGYAANLNFEKSQIGWLGAVPAIGAIISPLFVGLIADRFFPAQKMLCVLHLLGGACLIAAGFQDSFPLLMVAMLLNGLAFMPTIALVNSVTFRHIPDPDMFPRIAVLGTVGWIVAVLVASVFLGGAGVPNFLFLGGAGSLTMALYALTLPDTPPKGAGGGGDMFGLSALKLFRDPTFLIFIVCVFLFSIPACGYFFTLMVPMLQQRDYPSPLALTSLNQFAELVFMFSMPLFVAKLGLKRVLLIGMAAWVLRYVFFASPEFSMAIVGLILHGFCYSFFYVGAYMYVDRRAPAELKTSAQSLLAFLLLGVGYLLGAKGAGLMMEQFPAQVGGIEAIKYAIGGTRPAGTVALPTWSDPKAAESAWRYLDLESTIKGLWSEEKKEEARDEDGKVIQKDFGQAVDTDGNGTITVDEVNAIPDEGLRIGDFHYKRDDLVKVVKEIAALQKTGEDGGGPATEGQIGVTRKQWVASQSVQWAPIWLWPSGFAACVFLVFVLGFRDKPQEE